MSANTGVWLAYYYDWSSFRVFKSEIAAYRFAQLHQMSVVFLGYGEDPDEVVNR